MIRIILISVKNDPILPQIRLQGCYRTNGLKKNNSGFPRCYSKSIQVNYQNYTFLKASLSYFPWCDLYVVATTFLPFCDYFFFASVFKSLNTGPLKSMMPSFFILLSSFDNADRLTHRNCASCSLLIRIETVSVPDFACRM